MIYDNTAVRRQDRLMDEERAYELLRQGEYGVLSMTTPNGEAYGLPVNYAWDGNDALYIHCAPEGKKLRCIEAHATVSFCVVGNTHVISRKFTTNYESIVLRCQAAVVADDEERMEALRMIVEKYAPEFIDTGKKYAQASFHRTGIMKLTIKAMSGKRKNVNM